VCYEGTDQCPKDRQGGHHKGAIAELVLVITQMCDAYSDNVCHVTYAPTNGVLRFPISYNEHHKKAHLEATNIPLPPATDERWFEVKTFVKWLGTDKDNDADIKVDTGTAGTKDYSTSFAFTD